MDVVERLGKLLRGAGYGSRRAVDLRGTSGLVPPVDSLVALERHEDARLAVLTQLFTDCATLDREQVERVLAPLTLAELEQAAVIEIAGGRIRATIRVSDFDGIVLAGDPEAESQHASYVLPLTLSAKWLAHLTIRREIGSALDLGTGSGVQALLAARHADEVVGVDINPHALSMARVSQRLSGESRRISWVQGSWLEPLRGEHFDLVVANPPYVISPDNTFIFRDTEAAGDELSRKIVQESGAALAEGGLASVMCSWIHHDGGWEAPVREWVAGLGCDALLLRVTSEGPLEYAMFWNSSHHASDPEAFGATVDRWVAHYRRIGVQRIATGFVILRRRCGGHNWVRAFDMRVPRGKGAQHLERVISAGDFFAANPGARGLGELLSRSWRLLDGHHLDQSAVYSGGAYEGQGTMSMRPDAGIHARVDPRVLPLLLGCDGRRSLGELLDGAAVPEGVDRGDFHGLCVGAFRDLVARGYLVAEPVA